jgi:hypothetical protein
MGSMIETTKEFFTTCETGKDGKVAKPSVMQMQLSLPRQNHSRV